MKIELVNVINYNEKIEKEKLKKLILEFFDMDLIEKINLKEKTNKRMEILKTNSNEIYLDSTELFLKEDWGITFDNRGNQRLHIHNQFICEFQNIKITS